MEGEKENSGCRPRFPGMSHVSLACRNLEQAKLFYSRVLSGEWVHEIPGFVEYRIAGMIFGLAERSGGWIPYVRAGGVEEILRRTPGKEGREVKPGDFIDNSLKELQQSGWFRALGR